MSGPALRSMAWRNLWRNRRRTIITLISIGFGGFLAVMFTALQDRSFAAFIDTAARLGGGHVTLQHPEYLDSPALTRTVTESSRLEDKALEDPDVARAIQRITGPIMLSSARDSFGAFFIAYDPEREDASTLSLLDGLEEGESFKTSDDPGIILGRKLAQNLGVEMGRKVVYTLMDREGEIVAGMGRLSGVVSTGSPSSDAGLCLLPLGTARRALGYEDDESTLVALFLSDSRRSAAVAKRLAAVVGPEATALPWQETQPELSGFIAMKVGGARFMELIILILVAAGIFNTLFVSVMERIREFGIMLAIGFSPGQVSRLVFWESVWLAVVGVLLGGVFTLGPYLYLSTVGVDLSAMIGDEAVEVAGIGWDPILRVGIFPESLFLIVIAVVLSTLLAGVYPAWRAGRVAPVDSIRLV